MRLNESRSAGEGLERSCQDTVAGWLVSSRLVGGVELLSAWFAGEAYQKHRHDTYAVGVTDCGVQVFDYRGAAHASTPGQVVVLYPDEVHDGRAGTDEGFGYRIIYVEPPLLAEAVRALRGRPYPLPFVREPVSTNPLLSRALDAVSRAPLDPLAVDGLIVDMAHGLLAGERDGAPPAISRRVDVRAVERARQFLDAEKARVVHSRELESVTGLTRYDLARQFRLVVGTSPYRYLLMRRLEFAREQIHRERPLVEVACDAGFADQAHFTRVFRSAFGLTPARYRALRCSTITAADARFPLAQPARIRRPAREAARGATEAAPARRRHDPSEEAEAREALQTPAERHRLGSPAAAVAPADETVGEVGRRPSRRGVSRPIEDRPS